MFRSLRNTVFQTTLWNFNGEGGRGDHIRTHFLHFFLLQNPSPRSLSSSSSPISISSSKNHTSSAFVVSYLINSCGLSEDKAISTSKKVHFKTTSKPDSVLTLLENYGFSKPYISKLITCCSTLLLADPNKTLKPKLEFFNSIGLSGLDLAKVISKNPNILQRSLKKHTIPSYDFFKSILHTVENVVAALKLSSWVLSQDPGKRLVPNIGVLRDQGVPDSNISLSLRIAPRAHLVNVGRFKEIVKEIKGMGFDPLQTSFVFAVHVLSSLSNSTWDAKLKVFRRWGWSEDEIHTAFRKQPNYMRASEKKIMAIMDFLVNQMGFGATLISKHPSVLLFSLEKRIIPRCRVIQVLVSKDMVKKKALLTYILTLSEKSFLNKYVIKYGKEFPGLLKIYQGELDGLELTSSSEGVDKSISNARVEVIK